MNDSSPLRARVGAVVMAVAFLVVASTPAAAVPVLYRIDSLLGQLTAFPLFYPPEDIHDDFPYAPGQVQGGIVDVIPNTGAPASLMFAGGEYNYSVSAINPSPATAFGVFYQQETWVANDSPGTLGPNPAATTLSTSANGWEPLLPYFPAGGAQGTAAFVRITPGPARFGGAWDLGMTFNSALVFAKIAGGFTGGRGTAPHFAGRTTGLGNQNHLAGVFHPTTPANSPFPQFSSTQCPTTPATCPWTQFTGWQAENTYVRWTTGMVTGTHNNPPITTLPATSQIIYTGTDMRSGPMSSMGTMQLVSGMSSMGRGAVNAGGWAPWRMRMTFANVPEPGATAMLAAGCLGLAVIRRRLRS